MDRNHLPKWSQHYPSCSTPILPFYFFPCLSQCHGISAAVEWNTPTSHSSSLCGTLDCLHASLCVNAPSFNIECGCETGLIGCESLMSEQGNTFCMVFISTTYLYLKKNQQTIISFTFFRNFQVLIAACRIIMATSVYPIIRSLSCVNACQQKFWKSGKLVLHVVKSPWHLFPNFDWIHTTLSWLFKHLFSGGFTKQHVFTLCI